MSFSFDFSGRVVIVTGAAGGIGSAIVDAFATAGATVAALDLTSAPGGDVIPFEVDVTMGPDVEDAVSEIATTLGRPSIVVNNAGIGGRVGLPFTRLEETDWARAWEVNVIGLFNVSKAAVPHLKASSGGAIVNIASVSGRTGFQTSPPYSASKAAVINFTQVMARDLAGDGIRVNAVCPGMVLTSFYRAQRLAAAEANPSLAVVSDEQYFEDKVRSLIPLGRGQTPVEVASAVCFLASDGASAITGQSLNVDGGLVMS